MRGKKTISIFETIDESEEALLMKTPKSLSRKTYNDEEKEGRKEGRKEGSRNRFAICLGKYSIFKMGLPMNNV